MKQPKITRVHLIDNTHIEFYWDQPLASNGGVTKGYHILLDGKELSLYERTDSDEWHVGTVYEPSKSRTTVSLKEPLEPECAGKMRAFADLAANEAGQAADAGQICGVTYVPYYTNFTKADCGIVIKSNDRVSDKAHKKAREIIDLMLSRLPKAAEKMVEYGGQLAIYPMGEDAYEIPEHRAGALYMKRPVEGFGGVIENPVSSISEVNVLRILEGEYTTRYKEELILAHEFAHGIHLIGLEHMEDKSIAQRFLKVYEHAKEAGKWPDTYAISNYEEYFATLTTIWFNVMEEGKNGAWDGVRGPVNTREELYRYDREAYEFFASIYPEDYFGKPWDCTANLYDIDGIPYKNK